MTQNRERVVLLVDDEPRILSALRRTLRREGYEILTAGDARSALAELEARSIDLVISDHKMPGMSGTALLGRVAEQWPDTARILLSGWPGEIPPQELRAAKLDAMLAKPWEEAALRGTIRSALEG